MRPSLRPVLILSLAFAPAVSAQGAPALATTLDSTKDTVFARVQGSAPPARMHRVVQELSIAPGADDTTLFTQVSSFVVDRAGRFWVFDQGSRSVLLFGADGKLSKRVGRQGAGPGEFESNNGAVTLPGNRFALWDGRNARISWHGADGSFEKSTLVSKGFYTFGGLVSDREGGVFIKQIAVRDPAGGMGKLGLVRVRPDGTLGDTLVPPDLQVEVPSYVAIAEGGRGRATYQSRNAAGTQWLWHPDGHFLSVDGSHSRVILSRRTAKPLVIERRLALVPIPAEERADDQATITWGLQQTVPGWKWTGPDVPATKPSLSSAFAARDGRIWIRVATPSERIPASELAERRPNGPPVNRFRSSPEYEVFAVNGTFLARVALPRGAQLMEADGNSVWALGKDADDLPALQRFRIEPPLPRAPR